VRKELKTNDPPKELIPEGQINKMGRGDSISGGSPCRGIIGISPGERRLPQHEKWFGKKLQFTKYQSLEGKGPRARVFWDS